MNDNISDVFEIDQLDDELKGWLLIKSAETVFVVALLFALAVVW